MRECNFFCPQDISDPQQIVVCLYGYAAGGNLLVLLRHRMKDAIQHVVAFGIRAFVYDPHLDASLEQLVVAL